MIINNGTVHEAFQSFNTVFNKAFQEMEAQYPRVAMEVPSETRDENYAWLGAVPSMREWVGDREIQNLSAYGYSIRNKDFELTVGVDRNDLEDDRIGVYKPMFQDLAYKARKHPDKLVFGLFPRSFTEKCFDGEPFISDSHDKGRKIGPQSNKLSAAAVAIYRGIGGRQSMGNGGSLEMSGGSKGSKAAKVYGNDSLSSFRLRLISSAYCAKFDCTAPPPPFGHEKHPSAFPYHQIEGNRPNTQTSLAIV